MCSQCVCTVLYTSIAFLSLLFFLGLSRSILHRVDKHENQNAHTYNNIRRRTLCTTHRGLEYYDVFHPIISHYCHVEARVHFQFKKSLLRISPGKEHVAQEHVNAFHDPEDVTHGISYSVKNSKATVMALKKFVGTNQS